MTPGELSTFDFDLRETSGSDMTLLMFNATGY